MIAINDRNYSFPTVPGTKGYAEEAEVLLKRYEELRFDDVHSSVLHLIPEASSRILDIGSGTGRDAAAFAALGHQVVAVEPTDELRNAAKGLHPSKSIEWIADSLPALSHFPYDDESFDLIMLTAIWMHLSEKERVQAMQEVVKYARPGGKVILSLRHGRVPSGRRMFEVSAEETIRLAERFGLQLLLHVKENPKQKASHSLGVTWTKLAFVKQAL